MHVVLWREVMIQSCVDVFQSVPPGELIQRRELGVWSVEVAATTSSSSVHHGCGLHERLVSERSREEIEVWAAHIYLIIIQLLKLKLRRANKTSTVIIHFLKLDNL